MKLAQPHSDQLALVPTVVKLTEEKAVDLRSEQNQRALLGRQHEIVKRSNQETLIAKRRPETVEFTPRAQVRAAGSGQRKRHQLTENEEPKLRTRQCRGKGYRAHFHCEKTGK